MNIEAKDSAFPPSVQPGIPRLGRLPEGWVKAPLSRYLREVRRPLKMGDDTEYRLVTVKRSRGGVVERSVTAGREISVKSQFYVRSGDFLISKRQIVHGACGLVPESLDGSIVSNEYAVLNGSGEIDLRFLSYLSHSRFFQQTCFHSSIGVHVEKMIFKLDRWLSWDFHLPPLPEQQKIAEILGTWDIAIETTEALLANARTQKRALMQSLLTGTRRFPGFEDQPWREAKLGDHAAHITSGSRGWSDYYSETGDVFVRITNLTRASLQPDWSNLKFVSLPAGLNEGLRTRLRKDDVLISITADLGVIGFINDEPTKPHFINQHIALVRFDSEAVYPKFIAYYLASEGMQVTISNLNDSGAKAGLNLAAIRGIDLLLPTLAEQKQIAKLLAACDEEIDGLARQLNHLRTEKKSLMQQLLTGKRRVVV